MTEQQAPTDPGRAGFTRRNRWVLVLAAVLAVVAIVVILTWHGQHRELADQQKQISGLSTQLSTLEQKKAEQVDEEVLKTMGVSRDRLTRDGETIDQFLDLAFTWDSGSTYQTARDALIDRYDLAEDSEFLTSFMPPSRFNEDSSGKRYYYIDTAGLNSTVGTDADIEVVDVKADEYTYAVRVDVTVSADGVDQTKKAGEVTADRRMLLFVTIDEQGDLSDLSGVPPSGTTRLSG